VRLTSSSLTGLSPVGLVQLTLAHHKNSLKNQNSININNSLIKEELLSNGLNEIESSNLESLLKKILGQKLPVSTV